MMAEMFGLPWEGPVPKNMDFEPLALPPDPSQGDIQDQLQEMKAITIGNEDFQIFKMWFSVDLIICSIFSFKKISFESRFCMDWIAVVFFAQIIASKSK